MGTASPKMGDVALFGEWGSPFFMDWWEFEEGDEPYGLWNAMSITADLLEGSTEEAWNKYFTTMDEVEGMVRNFPQLAGHFLKPYANLFGYIGEQFLKGADQTGEYTAKYDDLWNRIGSQSDELNAEFTNVRNQLQQQYAQTQAAGPTTIGFGGQSLNVPNYRATREFLLPQANILGQQSDLDYRTALALQNTLAGQQNADTLKGQMLQGALQAGQQKGAIANTMLNTNMQVPSSLANIEQARTAMGLQPLEFFQNIAGKMTPTGATYTPEAGGGGVASWVPMAIEGLTSLGSLGQVAWPTISNMFSSSPASPINYVTNDLAWNQLTNPWGL